MVPNGYENTTDSISYWNFFIRQDIPRQLVLVWQSVRYQEGYFRIYSRLQRQIQRERRTGSRLAKDRKALPRGILPYPFPTTQNDTAERGPGRGTAHDEICLEETPMKPTKRCLLRGLLPNPFPSTTSKPQELPHRIPSNMKKHMEERISESAGTKRIPPGVMPISEAESVWDRDVGVRQRETEERKR